MIAANWLRHRGTSVSIQRWPHLGQNFPWQTNGSPADPKQLPCGLLRCVPLLGACPVFRLSLAVCVLLSLPSFLFLGPLPLPHSPFFFLSLPTLVWTLLGNGWPLTSGPQLFHVRTGLFAILWFLIDQKLTGGWQAPQSRSWLSRKSADLERFSDVVNNPQSTLSSVCFFQPALGTRCVWFSHSALCPFGDIHYLFRVFEAMPQNVIKNSKLFEFLPLLFKEL